MTYRRTSRTPRRDYEDDIHPPPVADDHWRHWATAHLVRIGWTTAEIRDLLRDMEECKAEPPAPRRPAWQSEAVWIVAAILLFALVWSGKLSEGTIVSLARGGRG